MVWLAKLKVRLNNTFLLQRSVFDIGYTMPLMHSHKPLSCTYLQQVLSPCIFPSPTASCSQKSTATFLYSYFHHHHGLSPENIPPLPKLGLPFLSPPTRQPPLIPASTNPLPQLPLQGHTSHPTLSNLHHHERKFLPHSITTIFHASRYMGNIPTSRWRRRRSLYPQSLRCRRGI
jgi:hypothetical protein